MEDKTIDALNETTTEAPEATAEKPVETSTIEVAPKTEQEAPKAPEADAPTVEKTFTQADVDRFIQERLTRVYAKAGAKNASEFEKLLTAKDEDLANARTQLKELQKSNALRDNNISPERYDDIDTWFKGKGKEFSADELVEAVKSHPEWVNRKITAPQIGGNIDSVNVNKGKNEADELARLLGYDKLV